MLGVRLQNFMGMSTLPVYLILATLVAPTLTKMGIPPIVAHLFIFYYGIIAAITPPVAIAAYAGASIVPGVIDAHTHIGYGSERDLETETKNAVSGGVTSLITYHRKAENYLETVPAFIDKINREAFCNVGIHLGLSTYEQTDQLATYVNEFKIPSFKYFTNYIGAAGVKVGVEIVSDANLIEWMTRIARLGGTLCIHAENQDVIEKRTAIVKAKGEDNLQGWYEARPPFARRRRSCAAPTLRRRRGAASTRYTSLARRALRCCE